MGKISETLGNDFSYMANTRASISAQNILRRISDVLNSDDLNCPEINATTELDLEECGTVSGTASVDQILDEPLQLNSDDLYSVTPYPMTYMCQDINTTTELYNEQNGTFNGTADSDLTLEESVDVVSLPPCENFHPSMQTHNNTNYPSNGAPNGYYVVVDTGFVPYFGEESVGSSNTPIFQSLSEENEVYG
ncbi:hypothetical protein DdX_13641 [Ditylenchus destructor]|uniref:Uncharacterized protein n=1 Tax=Ditylenchus destructor TaxID=166010 RepID=A0AAD4MSF6_9BILA|nr:hypothetical protein DdX_13641 [Ditylenchus destructor]